MRASLDEQEICILNGQVRHNVAQCHVTCQSWHVSPKLTFWIERIHDLPLRMAMRRTQLDGRTGHEPLAFLQTTQRKLQFQLIAAMAGLVMRHDGVDGGLRQRAEEVAEEFEAGGFGRFVAAAAAA